ncbi:MAG: UDP-N-acetylglucosamine 1-carboxyvinyltransferase [Kiritimatiellae bacterium]|nr:UDP-N-acetylglucosamine 1-carboxyvinyltransferase [Kiritimatiellia bacterium]
MARFVINGGKAISGMHRTPGNKNAALPMLAAALLTDEPVCLRNVPLIDDVRTMLEILSDLGVDVELRGHTVTLQARSVRKRRLNAELCSKVRSSILFAGPMAARYGRVTISPPGGDIIGRRRIDTHIEGLWALGIDLEGDKEYRFVRRSLEGASILLDEASVTATENIVMAAVLAKGESTIFNVACEPHVQALCQMLNAMGAHIEGIGTNRLRIKGVDSLGGATVRVPPDYIDTASFMAAAVVTGGALEITDADGDALDVMARPFTKLGITWKHGDDTLVVPARQSLQIQDDFGAAIPAISDGVWPNFPSDLMSIAIVVATQVSGTVLFFEKMFESRMVFVDRLIGMGARIVQCDPHRVIVSGPARLHGTRQSSPDIRAGMALLVAALCAKGESVIENAQCIDRGYEAVDARLRELGADIMRVE